MRFIARRFVLGLGAALIAGGWGMTRFAAEQRQAGGSSPASWWGAPASPRSDAESKGLAGKIEWAAEGGLPSMWIFIWGVVCMAAGAGLLGGTIPRLRSDDYLDGDADEPGRPQHLRLPV